MIRQQTKPHTHVSEDGLIVRCYHKCATVFDWRLVLGWFIGQTASFPVEHMIWRLPGFSHLCRLLGIEI